MKGHSLIKCWLTALCVTVSLSASNVHAAAVYTLLGLQMNYIKISQSSFDSLAVAARVGTWLGRGIGIELGANLPFTDEKIDSASVDMDFQLSAAIRLEGPLSAVSSAAYFLGGIATTRISGNSSRLAATANDQFLGPFIGLGLVNRLGTNTVLSIDFSYHAADKNIEIPGIHVGFRRSF
jgi:hypothetical protein